MPKKKTSDSTPQPATGEAAEQPAAGPSPAMLALFRAPQGIAERLAKAKRVNLPSMILPKNIPIFSEENQAILIGTIVKGTNSPASTVKGKCLWLRLPGGEERLLPCTGAIRQGLFGGDSDLKADSKELVAAIDKLAGKTYAFKRLEDTRNKKYDRDQFIFDIFELTD